MALLNNERWIGGKVYIADPSGVPLELAFTNHLVGAVYSGGFLRDPDGRLILVTR